MTTGAVMTGDRETQETIDRCRAANDQLKAKLIAAAAALVFLVVLAVIQFVVTMLAVRTLHDAKEERERTRREAFETLQRLQPTTEDGRTARDKPEKIELRKDEMMKDVRTKLESLNQPASEQPDER
jgi:flagellar biosynthesis/type III secretory pathway M-ring protein FliF/YscJ